MPNTRTIRGQKRSLAEVSDLHENATVAAVTPVAQKRAKPAQTKSTIKGASEAKTPATKSVSRNAPKAAPKANSNLHAKPKAPPKRRAKAKATTPPLQPSTPSTPRATLTGLPVELRLHIYSHLRATAMIHVHRPEDSVMRFTWTPCHDTNSPNPLLCANPKWPGMCAEKERCTYNKLTPSEPRGFFALAASCKALRSEIGDIHCEGIFIKRHDLMPWLGYMEKYAPQHLKQLRRITIEESVTAFWYLASDNLARSIKHSVPQLEAVAVQGRGPFERLITTAMDRQFQVNDGWWIGCNLDDCMREFGAKIDVTAEFIVLCDPRNLSSSWYEEEVLEEEIAVGFAVDVELLGFVVQVS